MKILLFVGAGSSVELGIPAMREMLTELSDYLHSRLKSNCALQKLKESMESSDYDLENFIESVESLEKGEIEKKKLDLKPDQDLLTSVQNIKWETEWYVKQCCERLTELRACTLWREFFFHTYDHDISIATTNYDRSFEIAASRYDAEINDGFELFTDREFAKWKGFETNTCLLKYFKIHGSTDWYRTDSSEVVKLRHAIPIFGDLSVSVQGSDNLVLSSSMILPTREKGIVNPPFPELTTDFQIAAKNAELALFLGTSFRDPVVNQVYVNCSNRPTTTVVINPIGLQSQMKSNDENRNFFINQTASEFLIVTLPHILKCKDNDEIIALCQEKAIDGESESVSILDSFYSLNNAKSSTEEICTAIETIADQRLSVSLAVITELINHECPDIRKFALALIPHSVDKVKATEFANEHAKSESDSTYLEELKYLNLYYS